MKGTRIYLTQTKLTWIYQKKEEKMSSSNQIVTAAEIAQMILLICKKKSGKNKNLENKFWGNKIETKNSLQKLKKKSNQIKNKENQKFKKKKIDFLFHFQMTSSFF